MSTSAAVDMSSPVTIVGSEPSGPSALDLHGESWRQWVLSNLQRGCAPRTMLRDMVKSTWAYDSAADALDEGLRLLGSAQAWRVQRPSIPPGDQIALPDGGTLRVLSRMDKPRAALLDGLLQPEECQELIATAERKGLAPSGVVDAATGASVGHAARTSTSVFFTRGETPLVTRIEARLARLTGWPVTHGEGLQVLRYSPGQQYKPHFDWFDPAKPGSATHLSRGGQRVGTTVMYLATAQAGGGTSFPKVGVHVNPRVGGAIFFNDIDALGEPDDMSLHGGTPVERGVKIVATYWQRERPFGGDSRP